VEGGRTLLKKEWRFGKKKFAMIEEGGRGGGGGSICKKERKGVAFPGKKALLINARSSCLKPGPEEKEA